ncbi:phosphodiester glycosidase family protein [Anaeroselena agilis]|uniref:Phosphodiester glycosidase family protein n=1 Tax=Anaeroselena agilis TaxID=3063788 RepID=A0ABU3P418_9FIRM|nr:phosphodiester glycosidase family protein [Selenomonadales bacterium 4137-cl]
MTKFRRSICLLLAAWIVAALALAQAAPPAVQKVRFHQTQEKVRVVFDMTAVPDFNVTLEKDPLRLLIDMPAAAAKGALLKTALNDPFVAAVEIQDIGPGQVRLAINLNMMVGYKVFKLAKPARLVVDLFKNYDQKKEEQIRPGIKYTFWQRSQPSGPIQAHILLIDPRAGLALQPVLSNGAVAGLETLASMSAGAKAIAAVNGSYFALNGEIIGLLKINGEIVSSPNIARTAVGIFPDGRIAFDQVNWQGYVEFPGGRAELNGVNRSRGDDELILYTGYFGPSTGTNAYGAEYVLNQDGVVTAIGQGNTSIEDGCTVLSAHGVAAKELAGLKVGDKVTVSQSLGREWDAAVHALGAGPMLIKDGSIYLTTKTEEFGSDVAGGRAPRTAIGLTKDGQLLLVVVDGRHAASSGLTLLELALFMQELGAVDAMNLDGGGSSQMVIYDKVVNRPSDGRERKVADGLAIVPGSLAK